MKKQIVGHSLFIITIITFLAIAGCGSSSSSGEGPAPVSTTLPGKVQNVNATDGEYSDKIKVTWDLVEGATSYAVHSSIQKEEGYSRCGDFEINDNFFEDTNVIINQVRYYKVSALNSAGEGDLSDSDAGNSHYGTPGVPKNVSATDGRFENKIVITWTLPESGASEYKIFRADAEDGSYSDISDGIITVTHFDDPQTQAELGTIYFYKIKSITAQGESDFSDAESGYTEEGPPGPSNVKASDASYRDKIVIQWDASQNALSYKIFRSEAETGYYSQIATVEPREPSYIPPNRYNDRVELNQPYFYKVQTVFEERESKLSEADSGYSDVNAVDPPENVSASDGEENVINVTWDEVSGDTITYEIFRKGPDDLEFTSIATDLSEFFHKDENIQLCATYSYRVKVTNGENTSHQSSYDDGYAKAVVPEFAPTNLTASKDNGLQLNVSWSAISGDQITYKLYRSENSEPFTEIAEIDQTTFIDDNAIVGVDYLYKVSAVNHGCSETDLSNPVLGFIPNILPVPEGLTLDSKWTLANGISIDVIWNEVPDATAYLIQRSSYSLTSGWNNWKDITTTQETLYSDNWKLIGTKYRYRVKALGVEPGIDGNFCDPEEIVAN